MDYIQIWYVDAWIHGLVPFEGLSVKTPNYANYATYANYANYANYGNYGK